jgi:hypothetical protein
MSRRVSPKTVQVGFRSISVAAPLFWCAAATAAVSLGDIQSWVGAGSNSAGLVIDWNDGTADESMLWGYHWNGTATGGQMLDAIVAADPHLYALLSGSTQSGTAVFGLGYDQNADGVFLLSPALAFTDRTAVTDYAGVDDSRVPVDVGDRWQEGWFTAGYWSYWATTSTRVAANSSDWTLSNIGITNKVLSDGDWDGETFAYGFKAVSPAAPVLAAYAAKPALAIAANSTVTATHDLFVGSLSIAGTSGAWTGKLDLAGFDLDVQGGNLTQITSQVAQGYNHGTWNNSGGIVSSSAAADTTRLTALCVILNDDGTGKSIYTSFDGQAVSVDDVLVKQTYYGDANLDGRVDGSDYTLIDNGYANHLTGWFNGDFNYDGVVDGSDYALMDNAFNNQGAAIGPVKLTAQVAAVPEPGCFLIASVIVAVRVRHFSRRKLGRRGGIRRD